MSRNSQTPPVLVTESARQFIDVQLFIKIFGDSWKPTSVEGVWMIGVDSCQFTIMERVKGDIELAFYDCTSLETFKTDFEEGQHSEYAEYFTLKDFDSEKENKNLCCAERIVIFLTDKNLWNMFQI